MSEKITIPWCMPFDTVVSGSCNLSNPFLAQLRGEFTGPDGETVVVPGFYDGDGLWKVRFAPTKVGTWTYRISSGDILLGVKKGEIECTKNSNVKVHGRTRVNPKYPYHFIYEDGTNQFMMVYECDWLWALDLDNPQGSKTEEFINSIKEYGFNHIIMNVYAQDTSWAKGKTCEKDYGPPALYAWEGSNENPDHSRFNTAFFKNYDKVMTCLLNEGITAHILFKVYNKAVNWPKKYSQEDDLYFKYIVSRYQAFPNIIWDYSKEAYYEKDKEYIHSRLELIKSLDAYKHLVTLHDDKIYCNDLKYNGNIDFITAQQHNDLHYSVLYEREKRKWPIFNSEFGYEWGPSQKALTWTAHSPEEFIRRAYEVVMAGGYPGYYYDCTAWDIIDYSITPKGYSYFKTMYDFFTSIEWWRLEPRQGVCCYHGRCLADSGKEYVMYIGEGKRELFNLDFQGRSYSAEWMNILTGEKVAAELHPGPISPELFIAYCPFTDVPGILHIVIG